MEGREIGNLLLSLIFLTLKCHTNLHRIPSLSPFYPGEGRWWQSGLFFSLWFRMVVLKQGVGIFALFCLLPGFELKFPLQLEYCEVGFSLSFYNGHLFGFLGIQVPH